MTRRDFLSTAAAIRSREQGGCEYPFIELWMPRAHCTPEQLRHFWSSTWPEAVRDVSRGGIELQTSDGPGEVRSSAGDNPIRTVDCGEVRC
jgi:hypothetical protein